MAENVDFDAIIVGGGPIGTRVAAQVARSGHSTLVLEEHGDIGRPVQCAGLVTLRVLEMTGYDKPLNRIKGADIFPPGGERLSFRADVPKAVAIDRADFDVYMAGLARDGGAEVRTGAAATSAGYLSRGKECTGRCAGPKEVRVGLADGPSLTCRLLVGADGIKASVSRWFGLPRAKDMVSCFERRYEGLHGPSDMVSIFVGRDIAPNFFAWVIPQGSGEGLVGIGVSDGAMPAKGYLDRLSGHPVLSKYLEGATAVEELAGAIPLGVVSRISTDNVMVVGDAAGQVKPMSGGGLFSGLTCADHCATVAIKALDKGDVSAKPLSRYRAACEKDVHRELLKGLRLRKVFKNLDDGQLDELARILSEEDMLGLIISVGDIDNPSVLATRMLRRMPSLVRFSGPYLRSFLS